MTVKSDDAKGNGELLSENVLYVVVLAGVAFGALFLPVMFVYHLVSEAAVSGVGNGLLFWMLAGAVAVVPAAYGVNLLRA